VQTVLVQEQALKAAQERIAELEAKAGAAAQASSGFLGSAPRIGPWGSQPAAQGASAAPPSTRSPLQAALAPQAGGGAAGGGGGFLRTAMMTAAGVAGGALLFEGIRGLMGSNPGPFGSSAAAAQPSPLMPADNQSSNGQSSDGQQQGFADDGNSDDSGSDYDTADSDMGGSDDDFA
jgi:hypothetical protein